MKQPKPKGKPHVFVEDQETPPDPTDRTGRKVCRDCRMLGRPGDAHHDMPEPVPDVAGLAAGEGDRE